MGGTHPGHPDNCGHGGVESGEDVGGQNLICTLGDLSPRPREEWLKLAHKVENALVGQGDLFDKPDAEVEEIVRKVKERRAREQAVPKEPEPKPGEEDDLVTVHTDLWLLGAHFPPVAASGRNPHFPMCAGLPPPRGD